MSRRRTIIRLSAVLAVVALAKGCGDGESPSAPPTPEPARPTTVAVSPATHELTAFGATVQLMAEVRDQNARVMAGATVTWTSSASSVATVDESGLVTGVAEGVATITASAGGAQGTAEITVDPNPDRAALVAFYEATDGPNWVNSENWLTDAPLGEWYGVDTDASGRVVGRVTALDLSRNGLAGRLPGSLSELAHMTELRIAHNTDLSGRLPLSLADLSLRALHYAGTDLCAPVRHVLPRLAERDPIARGHGCGVRSPVGPRNPRNPLRSDRRTELDQQRQLADRLPARGLVRGTGR